MNDFSQDRETCLSRFLALCEANGLRNQNESGQKIERWDSSDILDWETAEDRGMTLEKIRELYDRCSFSDLEFLANWNTEDVNSPYGYAERLNLFEKNI